MGAALVAFLGSILIPAFWLTVVVVGVVVDLAIGFAGAVGGLDVLAVLTAPVLTPVTFCGLGMMIDSMKSSFH